MVKGTREEIISYIEKYQYARVADLVHLLKISNVSVHKNLNKLLAQGIVSKSGRPPEVYYMLAKGEGGEIDLMLSRIEDLLDKQYLQFKELLKQMRQGK